MPVKPEVVAEVFGIDTESFADDDAFKAHVAENWTKVSEAPLNPKVRGAVFGKINTVLRGKAKKLYSALDIDASDVKFDETDPDKLIDLLTERAPAHWKSKIDTLEEAVKGKDSEAIKKQYEGKLTEAQKRASDFEALATSRGQEMEQWKQQETKREIDRKVGNEWDTAIRSVKFKQGIDEFTKKGFIAEMQSIHRVAFDDEGNAYATDSEGKRIPDKQKHQSFLDLSTILREKAKEFKLDETNVHGGKPVGGLAQREVITKTQEVPVRKIAAAARV